MRQYIGARYVPRFSEVNNGNWSSVYSYEPLIIVKNGNDFYTSKKSVPVGIQITNTEYWVKTGDYNGAITQLQNEINTINDSIDMSNTIQNFIERYQNKRVVIYGDSLSVPSGTWAENFKDLVESIGGTVTNHAHAGDPTSVQLSIANADNNVYDYAIVWVGTNDSHTQTPFGAISSTNTFNYQYNQLLNRILTVSPNCQVFCFGLPYSTPRSLALTKSEFFYSACIRSIAFLRGCCYKSMEGMPNNGIGNNTATSDGTHFTSTYTNSTLIYCIINKLCSMTTEDDMIKNLAVAQADFLSSLSSGVTIRDFHIAIDIDGNCVLNMWFDASGLTSTTIAQTSTWITPNKPVYVPLKNNVIGFSPNGNFQTNNILENGTYCFQIVFRGRWITELNFTSGT